MTVVRVMATAGITALALAGPAYRARACGGFFCDGTTPIVQASENIVFAVEPDGTLETHVQILYSGAAPRFAWLLPVPSEPRLGLGSNALFTALDDATAPRFELERRVDGTCRRPPACRFPPPCGAGRTDAATDASGFDAGGMVTVHARENVGAFDAVVLTATNATTLLTWLAVNGYAFSSSAIPALEPYVAAGDYFVALKLLSDRSTGEIQPIVMRFQASEPCIPIRLTAIATVPDMPITAYVLASSFAVSGNYSFVDPPEEPALWLESASYAEAVTRAVDAAGGHAFVTDYAGDTPPVSLSLPSIADLRAPDTTPSDFVRGVYARGFAMDSELEPVLERVLPPPPGVDPTAFYDCLASACAAYAGYVPDGWSPAAAVDALDEAIVAPRSNAEALVRRHARLTRLFTTLSAAEMTIDPVFALDVGAPAVGNVRRATLVTECTPDYFAADAPQRLELPSGGAAHVRDGHTDGRSDEDVCRAAGGTLGEPAASGCGPDGRRDAGPVGTDDAGPVGTGDASFDAGAGAHGDGAMPMDGRAGLGFGTDGADRAWTASGGGCRGCAAAPHRPPRASTIALVLLVGALAVRRRRGRVSR